MADKESYVMIDIAYYLYLADHMSEEDFGKLCRMTLRGEDIDEFILEHQK